VVQARVRMVQMSEPVQEAGSVVSGAPGEVAQGGAGLAEFDQTQLNLGEVLFDQPGDVAAGCLAAVAQGQDAADLGKGEPGSLGVADEAEPRRSLGRVVAVAAGGPRWRGQEANLLVEADGLRAQSAGGREVADAHGLRLTLDLPLRWKV
jgi:hypothetical protein